MRLLLCSLFAAIARILTRSSKFLEGSKPALAVISTTMALPITWMFFNSLWNGGQPTGGGEPTPVPTALNPNADVNGDNIVNASDLLEVMNNWHRVVP